MKKLLHLSFYSLFALSAFGQTTIPNQGFESWFNMNVKDSLDYWRTSTLQFQQQGNLSVNNSYEVGSAHNGSKAIHLETVSWYNTSAGQNDTLFGYAIQLNADNGDFMGFPYTDTVDLFTCWYKSNVLVGDQAIVIIELSKGGVVYSSVTYPISGVQNTWTQLSFPLPGGALEEPDSVFVGFASSDPFTPGVAKPGSWIEIDDVSFGFIAGSVVPSPIPNNSFENWTYTTVEQATDWFSFDQLFYPMTGSAYSTKSTTAAQGTYSIQIETTFENIMIGIPSVVTNGYFDPGLDSVIGGAPFYAQPSQISGSYQFAPSLTDTAFIFVDFWNSVSGLHNMYVDTLLDAATWTNWSIDLNFTEAPDSMLVFLWGGKNLGSTLLVDNIQFSGGDLSAPLYENLPELTCYPNPTTDALTINFGQSDLLRIFDSGGNLIEVLKPNQTTLITIDTRFWGNGTYIIQSIYQGKATSVQAVVLH